MDSGCPHSAVHGNGLVHGLLRGEGDETETLASAILVNQLHVTALRPPLRSTPRYRRNQRKAC